MSEDRAPRVDDGISDRWCAGLQKVSRRRLDADERAWVQRRIARDRRRVWLTTGVAALVLAASAAGAVLVGGSGLADSALVVAATWILELGLVGIAACLLTGRRLWRLVAVACLLFLVAATGLEAILPATSVYLDEVTSSVVVAMLVLGNAYTLALARDHGRVLRGARVVRDDAQAAWVERFEGTLESDLDDPAVQRLVARGYLARGQHGVQWIEILPRSSLVVRANGRPVEHWARAHVAEIAPPRPFAMRIELPRELVRVENDPSVTLKRRSLSPAERVELARHIVTLRCRYWPPIVVTVGVAGLVGVRLWAEGPDPDLLSTGSLLWYALALLTYLAYLRRIRAARRLEWDRELRWVVTVHDRASLTSNEETGLAPKLEMLPISQLAWTENARPAAWRTSKL
jgi:hypothetical protein